MKITQITRLFSLAFVFTLFSFSQMMAQGSAIVVSETESFSQATYTLTSANKEAEVTIRKEQGKVSILLKNAANGNVLGRARVVNNGGTPNITIQTSKPETLPFWEFALDRIIPDGNGVALSPRKKALKKCNDKCKQWVRNNADIQVLTIGSGGSSQTFVPLDKVKKAFEAYQKCMWKCMKEAKSRQ